MVTTFFLKVALEVINLFCNNRIAFWLVKQFEVFDAVFVMYPADQEFADALTFRCRQRRIRFRPFITGVIVHPNCKRTLVFAVSAFIDKAGVGEDEENLRLLHARTEDIRKNIGAKTTHFAGTLPGRFTNFRIRRGTNQKNERLATVENVVNAIRQVREMKSHTNEHSVIVLGGNGFIGRGVVDVLRQESVTVISIDKNGGDTTYTMPKSAHLVVNIMTPGAIREYIDEKFIGPSTTVLNEVYPAPHQELVEEMNSLGADVFHIVGVVADAYPSFPKAYRGAVPCCAALTDANYRVGITKL